MSTPPRVKLALFGLGRLGSIRARIIVNQQPLIELVAACDPRPDGAVWCADNLPPTVKYFSEVDDCLAHAGIDAVLICTGTSLHAPIILKALDLGYHVMCEKPISVDIETTRQVIEAAQKKPSQRFLVPFCRRFDRSYAAAQRQILAGGLGQVHAVECESLDKQDPSGFFVQFSAQSGGIYVDMAIHDIDIGRYLLDVTQGIPDPKRQVKKVFAWGQRAVYPGLEQYNDADNAWGMVEFTNGKVLNLHVGRTLTNGYENRARIFGTKGTIVISSPTSLELRDEYGARTTTVPDFFGRFEQAFVDDLHHFAESIVKDQPLAHLAEDAFEAGKIAVALQHSYQTGAVVLFDNEGMPILN